MRAGDLMTEKVITIDPEATIGEAADLMLRHDISCLPALDQREKLVGILTHTDFGLRRKFMPLADNLTTLMGD